MTIDETNEPLLVSRGRAAALLGLSQRSVDLLIASGRLASTRAGKRVLVPLGAVREFAQKGSSERIRPA